MNCENCCYFLGSQEDKNEVGTCRRFPRTVLLHKDELEYFYPVQFSYDYCGEHKKLS
jgi:hypothetical protein